MVILLLLTVLLRLYINTIQGRKVIVSSFALVASNLGHRMTVPPHIKLPPNCTGTNLKIVPVCNFQSGQLYLYNDVDHKKMYQCNFNT